MERRRFLGGVGAVAVALSGCTTLGRGGGENNQNGGSQSTTEPVVAWSDDHLGDFKYAVSVKGALGGSGKLKFRKNYKDSFFHTITGNPGDRFEKKIVGRGGAPMGPLPDGATLTAEVPGDVLDYQQVSAHIVGSE